MSKTLQDFVEEFSGDEFLRVQDDLGHGFVRLRAAEAQRRQAKQDIRSFEDVVLEMLRNARDAHARAIFVATWVEGATRKLTMLDDGDGVPLSMHDTVFEPFVTSKLDSFHDDRWGVHGRGMALYSIKQNVVDAHIAASSKRLGSIFSVTSRQSELPEKRDQSTLPIVSQDNEGKPLLRGPHNIARMVMEFAIDERSRISVYLGSSAAIVATLYSLGLSAASRLTTVFDTYDESTPYIYRFAYVDDAESLAQLANEFELPISTRTAHRILNGEIEPLPLHLELLASDVRTDRPKKPSSSKQKKRSIKVTSEDLHEFNNAVHDAYVRLAEKYYLDSPDEISSQVQGNELRIRIPLIPGDRTEGDV